MSGERRVSDVHALTMAAIALVIGVLYVGFGIDWYYKGHLVMCYCELTVKPTSWCYQYAGRPCKETWWLPQCRPAASDSACDRAPYTSECILSTRIGTVTPCYKGATAQRAYDNDIGHRFELWWNSFFVEDENRRLGLASVVTLMYAAFLAFVGSVLKDWWLQPRSK
jgi:hypothetical protein